MPFSFLEAWRRWRDKGRYDLNKLREVDAQLKTKTVEPEEDAPNAAERNLIYCRHCGASMAQKYSICPDCGIPLGS